MKRTEESKSVKESMGRSPTKLLAYYTIKNTLTFIFYRKIFWKIYEKAKKYIKKQSYIKKIDQEREK